MFSGSMVALVTPFKNGGVDWQSLEGLIAFHLQNGTNGIVPCGTTGESATLSHEEHDAVIRAVIKAVNKRVPVIAGTGSNSTEEAVRLTREAEKSGADGALMISPYYNRPTQEGIYQHYKKVAAEVGIPIIVYNIPGRTGSKIEPETLARLSEIKNIAGVKEATGSVDQAIDVIRLCGDRLAVYSGEDTLIFSDGARRQRRDLHGRQCRAERNRAARGGLFKRRLGEGAQASVQTYSADSQFVYRDQSNSR
jgi:4-hydroxy-tetrahydrodipicolinate synthase